MHRFIWPGCIAAGLVLAVLGCSGDPEDDAPAPNPVERRLEPARDAAARADSVVRAREQEVRELTREPSP